MCSTCPNAHETALVEEEREEVPDMCYILYTHRERERERERERDLPCKRASNGIEKQREDIADKHTHARARARTHTHTHMCVCTSKCASHGIEEKREDIADTLCDSVTSMLRRPVESDGVALGDANGHLKVLKPRPPSFELSKAIERNGAAQYRLIGVKREGALCYIYIYIHIYIIYIYIYTYIYIYIYIYIYVYIHTPPAAYLTMKASNTRSRVTLTPNCQARAGNMRVSRAMLRISSATGTSNTGRSVVGTE